MSVRLITPFPDTAWPNVWQWIQPFKHRVHDDFSPRNEDAFVEWMRRRTDGNITVGVESNDQLGGLIWFERGNEVAGVVHVVLSKPFWGPATAGPALTAAVRAFFLVTNARKLNTQFFARNDAVRAVSKEFGFVREGRLRSQTLQDGEPVDMETWGILREEFFAKYSTSKHRRPTAP